jgi:hypothetical protein
VRILRWLLALFAVAGAVWLFFGVRAAREAARRSQCRGHLAQIQLALWNYHEAHGHFPPAFIAGPDGRPWHSWRVLILPYRDEQAVYDAYRFDEPWDGPHNRLLEDKLSGQPFQCPSGPDGGRTLIANYVAIVGDDTIFPSAGTVKESDIEDGLENTILVAEIDNSDIHWMEPRDLDAATMSFVLNDTSKPSISSPHPAGPAVVFADGITPYSLREPLSSETLRALITIAGGESLRRDDLKRWSKFESAYLTE